MEDKTKLLFVCLGNIVRSPLAEHLFARMAEKDGAKDRYEVDSAGIGSWHVGEAPDRRMREVAAGRGLYYTGSAREFVDKDFERFDLILAMDESVKLSLASKARSMDDRAKILMMRTFDPRGGPKAEVPDPYYGGLEGFERVYDIVERSCTGLLGALEEGELPRNGA